MGSISHFLTAFDRDGDKYLEREREVKTLCEDALKGVKHFWQSRIKDTKSLGKKLKDLITDDEIRSGRVPEIRDLIGVRIIVLHMGSIKVVEDALSRIFHVRDRTPHPSYPRDLVDASIRFRGYSALHLYVTLEKSSEAQTFNPVIEIQMMSILMYMWMDCNHDILYKKKRGEPSEDVIQYLELLKGIMNLGEIGMQMFEKSVFKEMSEEQALPIANSFPRKVEISQHLQVIMRTVVAEVGFERLERRNLPKIPHSLFKRLEDWLRSSGSPILWIRQSDGPILSKMAAGLSAHLVHGALERRMLLICYRCHPPAKVPFQTFIKSLNRQLSCYHDNEESVIEDVTQAEADGLTAFSDLLARISDNIYGVFSGFQTVTTGEQEDGDLLRFQELLLSCSERLTRSKFIFVTQRDDQSLDSVLSAQNAHIFRDASPQCSVAPLEFASLD